MFEYYGGYDDDMTDLQATVVIEHLMILRKYLTTVDDVAIWKKANVLAKNRRNYTKESLLADIMSIEKEYCQNHGISPMQLGKQAARKWVFIREVGIVRKGEAGIQA